MPRHILIKLPKIKYKEKILKAAREKQQITHKGIPIRLTAVLSAETLQARRGWQDIFKVMKGKNLQPRLLYPFGRIYMYIPLSHFVPAYPSPLPCPQDHLEGWDREGQREGDARGKRYGDICICIADSLCYKAETNIPL